MIKILGITRTVLTKKNAHIIYKYQHKRLYIYYQYKNAVKFLVKENHDIIGELIDVYYHRDIKIHPKVAKFFNLTNLVKKYLETKPIVFNLNLCEILKYCDPIDITSYINKISDTDLLNFQNYTKMSSCEVISKYKRIIRSSILIQLRIKDPYIISNDDNFKCCVGKIPVKYLINNSKCYLEQLSKITGYCSIIGRLIKIKSLAEYITSFIII